MDVQEQTGMDHRRFGAAWTDGSDGSGLRWKGPGWPVGRCAVATIAFEVRTVARQSTVVSVLDINSAALEYCDRVTTLDCCTNRSMAKVWCRSDLSTQSSAGSGSSLLPFATFAPRKGRPAEYMTVARGHGGDGVGLVNSVRRRGRDFVYVGVIDRRVDELVRTVQGVWRASSSLALNSLLKNCFKLS
ncbi:unnamed protein product [Calypogeia fissa]